MELSYDLPCRLARLTFAVLLTFAWCGGTQDLSAQVAPVSATPVSGRGPTPDDMRRLEKTFDAMGAAVREAPRDSFDPQAVIDQVGRDPEKLAAWVRERTFWVPYAGALRGPVGVLMDRLGNSLDRSLLLAEVLNLAGHTVRLAHGNIAQGDAAALAGKIPAVPESRFPATAGSEDGDAELARFAAGQGIDAKDLFLAREQATAAGSGMAEKVVGRTVEQAAQLREAVPGKSAVDAARVTRALADHWWVQRESGGNWVDMDLLAAAGAAPLATPAETLPYASGKLPLKPEHFHEVELRLVIEKTEAGKAQEVPVLSHTLRPMDVVGLDVTISNRPMKWPETLKLAAKDAEKQFRDAALAQKKWVPVIQVGKQQVFKASFDDAGVVTEDATPDARTEGAGKVGSGVGSGFGGFGGFGGGGASEPAAKSVLTAQWVDYVIKVPGEAPRTIRRTIFDAVGPAARAAAGGLTKDLGENQRLDRAFALLGRVDVLPLGCQLSPQYLQYLGLSRSIANRSMVLSLAKQTPRNTKEFMQVLKEGQPGVGPLYGLAVGRATWSPVAGDVYLDRPNVLTSFQRGRVAEGGKLSLCQGIDIVANEVAVRPGSQADGFTVRLTQGVCDTNAEAILVSGCAQVQNTAEAFAVAAGGGWVAVKSADEPAWKTVQAPDDAKRRIEQDLAAGNVVLLPKQAPVVEGRPMVAWWRVDPATGTTLGIGESGAGQAMSEYAVSAFWGAVNAALCMTIAGMDKDGVTVKDGLACIAVGFAAGAGAAPVIASAEVGTAGCLWFMFGTVLASSLTGLDKNKDVPD